MKRRTGIFGLALLLLALFPVGAALAEDGGADDPWATTPDPNIYQEGDGWVYENGVFTITENGGWEHATIYDLPTDANPNRNGYEGIKVVNELVIGKEVSEPFWLLGYDSLFLHDSPETVRIEEGNTCFAIINGWVVNTWTHTLVCAEHPRESQETAVVIDNLPEEIRSIGAYAFGDYRKLTEIILPAKVTVIEDCAFNGCSSLTQIELPENLHTIKDAAFSSSALETCNWPDKLEILGQSAFAGTNLTAVDLSNTRIRSIPGWCFSFCEELAWIALPESLVVIESDAFLKCTGLKTVVFDANGVVVEGNAFERCTSLASMVFLRESPQLLGVNEFRIDGPTHWLDDAGDIPDPVFYYTEAYKQYWASDDQKTWYKYGIELRPITLEGIDALLTQNVTPEPTSEPTPEPTSEPTSTPANTPTDTPTETPAPHPAAEPAKAAVGAWVYVLSGVVLAALIAAAVVWTVRRRKRTR